MLGDAAVALLLLPEASAGPQRADIPALVVSTDELLSAEPAPRPADERSVDAERLAYLC